MTSYQNSCATYGNDCAQPLKWLCKVLGTVVPKAWHKHAKGVARAKHTYQGTLYQIVKLE
ncbi:hypothetical protein [Bacteroides faecis]|uniref:hypothetical protein n=1 Tax=Bacteroides faecis TaxID=674529 RepID=UPI0018A0558B|nr:hypothetical protein [Bacteroides faecis]